MGNLQRRVLKSYRVTKLQSCRVAEVQRFRGTEAYLMHHKILLIPKSSESRSKEKRKFK
jgi:hypothetical protein